MLLDESDEGALLQHTGAGRGQWCPGTDFLTDTEITLKMDTVSFMGSLG